MEASRTNGHRQHSEGLLRPARHPLSVAGLVADEACAGRLIALLEGSWPTAVDAMIVADVARLEMVLAETTVDVVLCDLDRVDDRGFDLVDQVARAIGMTPLVVLLPGTDSAVAERALRTGARDYLFKERLDEDNLARALRHSIERRAADGENRRIRQVSRQLRGELDQYVGAMAHDLRAPVRTARLFTDRLLAAVANETDPAPVAEALGTSLERLELMIDSLLRLGALRDSPVRPERERLAAIVADVAAELGDDLRAAGGSLRCEGDGIVSVDPTMIRALLVALVENSIRHRDPRRPPVVTVALAEAEPVTRLLVSDNGPGVPAAYRDRALGLFERLSAESGEPGLGFGLAFCRRIAELHHGSLGFVEPTDSVGAVVELALPAGPGGPESPSPLPVETRSPPRSTDRERC